MKNSGKIPKKQKAQKWNRLHKFRQTGAVLLSVILAAAFLPSEIMAVSESQSSEDNYGLSNPVVLETFTGQKGKDVTWDCIWFGTYPQEEITEETDSALYEALEHTTDWECGDTIIDGKLYHRINGHDVTVYRGSLGEGLGSSGECRGGYVWNSLEEYHYFEYQPIKWRVLQVEDGKAFLLADDILDCQQFGTPDDALTWENSTLRSWLNGYSQEANLEQIDNTTENFIDRAFHESEQAAICETRVVNADSLEWGTDAGNDTTDRIYVLSESEVTSKIYGFDGWGYKGDCARVVWAEDISTYANAMGQTRSTTTGGFTEEMEIKAGKWWLRSPGNRAGRIRAVYEWGILKKDTMPQMGMGIRPALYLDLSKTELYTYAGKVYSDGSQDEVAAPVSATREVTVEQPPTATGIIYGQTLADSSLAGGKVTAGGTTVEGTWRFTDPTIAPKVSDSNTAAYEVQFFPKDRKAYDKVKTKVSLTVEKCDNPPVTIPENAELSTGYGEDKTIGDVSLGDYYPGWSWSEDSRKLSLAIDTPITAEAVYEDSENYENVTAEVTVVMSSCTHQYSPFVSNGDATCLRDGTMTTVCAICGKSCTVAEVGSRLGHNYELTVNQAVDCTRDGKKVYICVNGCHQSYTETEKARGHVWTMTESVASSCTQGGSWSMTCVNCGKTEGAEVPAMGHYFDQIEEIKTADCTHDGLRKKTCSVCKTVVTETVKAAGHEYGAETAEAATCTESGAKIRTCNVCGHVEKQEIPPMGHEYGVAMVEKRSTCKETGIQTRLCLRCFHKEKTVIPKKAHNRKSMTEPASTERNGYARSWCCVCGTQFAYSTIYAPKSVKLAVTEYICNGKVRKPEVTVKDSRGKILKKGTDYTVIYSPGCKNPGKYTVTICFKGNYTGTVTKSFTIVPKDVEISKVTARKKGFVVSWKKQSQAGGYQLQYSTSKNFKGSTTKTVTISSNKTTSKTMAGLKAKKKYYVRIRTCAEGKVNGKTVKLYSGWSKAKTVTTGK